MFTRGKSLGGPRGSDFSFIGPEVTVTGDISTPGAIHVDGNVTGDIRCGTLTQGEGGAVRGNIVASEARLAGLIDGGVEAGILTLEASARITGDVLYETLAVAAGAEVEGRFRRRRSERDAGSAGVAGTSRPAPARGPIELFPDAPTAEAAE